MLECVVSVSFFIIYSYWNHKIKYCDESYRTIPFPFDEMNAPPFSIEYRWSLNQLISYINTWSAVKRFIQKNGYHPVEELKDQLTTLVKDDEVMDVRFKIIMRVGII